MLKGRIRWFAPQKGYGFIKSEETNQYVFVHYFDIIDKKIKVLAPGDLVEFELQETPLGPRAIKVRKISPEKPRDEG
ncbi:MAG: cold shock domain-containing protein [candidate division WOR-3 bacterium]